MEILIERYHSVVKAVFFMTVSRSARISSANCSGSSMYQLFRHCSIYFCAVAKMPDCSTNSLKASLSIGIFILFPSQRDNGFAPAQKALCGSASLTRRDAVGKNKLIRASRRLQSNVQAQKCEQIYSITAAPEGSRTPLPLVKLNWKTRRRRLTAPAGKSHYLRSSIPARRTEKPGIPALSKGGHVRRSHSSSNYPHGAAVDDVGHGCADELSYPEGVPYAGGAEEP